MNDTPLVQDELETLKARAEKLGIRFHPSISLEKLRDKVTAAIEGEEPEDEKPVASVPAETEGQMKSRMKREALRLVRIRVTCMNPLKSEWDGELLTVGNTLIGTVTKFVPFNVEDGWHVPQIMLEMMQQRQCQTFYTVKNALGQKVRKGKLIKEFAIEILPDLTERELKDLAQRQAMAKGQD
jgi:hypothetical protein